MGRGSTQTAAIGRYRGVASSIPTTSGTYSLKLSALDDVAHTNFVPGRQEGVEAARAKGVKLPPIVLTVDKAGKVTIEDGNHRIRAARAAGDKTIRARVEVTRGPGTWASRKRPR
jgi:uncharacterized ParB-like nuclease family protein